MDGILRIGFDLFTEAAYVYVHAARSDEAIGAPDGVEQLIPGEDAIRTRSKVIEQTEFQRAERNGFSGMADAVRRRVDGQFADFDDARRIAGRLGTTQQRFDARKQLSRAERLRDVIVGAHFEAHDAVGFVAARGEHQDGQAVQRFVLANFAANFQAGKFRQHQIEKQQIGRSLLERAQAGAAVKSGADLKTFIGEVVTNEFDDVAVVFDNKDAFHAGRAYRVAGWAEVYRSRAKCGRQLRI